MERRDGMGSGFPFDGHYLGVSDQPKTRTVVVAQRVLEQNGRPFTPILQMDQPFGTDFWDGRMRSIMAVAILPKK